MSRRRQRAHAPLDPKVGPSEPSPEPAAYANHFEVGYNAFEFLFDFAQDYDSPDGTAHAHTRIVTAPAFAKVFSRLLDRSIVDYEAAFGLIAEPLAAQEPEPGEKNQAPGGPPGSASSEP